MKILKSCLLISTCPLFIVSSLAAMNPWYWKVGAGKAWSNRTTFTDNHCTDTSPPALFGCGYHAKGDFGDSANFDMAIGYRVNPVLRTELSLNYQPHYHFSGNANFAISGPYQPVSSNVSSLGLMAVGDINLAAALGDKQNPWQPFVGAGLGVARNHTSTMTYQFPFLNRGAFTKTPSGNATNFTYMLSTGIDWQFSKNMGLELSYRWYNLGKVKTNEGPTHIHKHGCGHPDCTLNIAGTQADLTTQSLMLSFWHTL